MHYIHSQSHCFVKIRPFIYALACASPHICIFHMSLLNHIQTSPSEEVSNVLPLSTNRCVNPLPEAMKVMTLSSHSTKGLIASHSEKCGLESNDGPEIFPWTPSKPKRCKTQNKYKRNSLVYPQLFHVKAFLNRVLHRLNAFQCLGSSVWSYKTTLYNI